MPADAPDLVAPLPTRLRGEVVYLYAFDVANEVHVERAAELLSIRPQPFAARADRPGPATLPTAQPLTLEVPDPSAHIGGAAIRVIVRVYNVGVVTVALRAPFERAAGAELLGLHGPALDDGRALDALARQHYTETRRRLADALVRPGPEAEPEAYTVFCLTDLGGERDANRWLADNTRAAAGLLTATPGDRLSEQQVTDALRLRRSFENSDLVVVDWDAALVVELDGSPEDVLFVLELANLQLEEFRWMDRTLDTHLERAYADLARGRSWGLGGVGATLRSLRQLRVDLARLADEVTHSTKFLGDWHLARVYALARERFHLGQWRASVGERLGDLDRLYTTARGDLYDRRMLVLEVVVVLFFAVDLLFLFFRK